jgi:alanine-glyoxylate transaminase/serine-glyoxylate transaminase/serine-pyruvate transaminase
MFSLRSFNTVALRSTTTAKRGLAVANPLGTSVSPQLAPATRTLLGPGPQNAHPRVHSIMSLPQVGHMDPDFLKTMEDVKALLRYVWQTENSFTVPVSGTGSAAWEAAVANLTEPGDKHLICNNGYFGERALDLHGRYTDNICEVTKPYGEVFTKEDIEQALQQHKPQVMWLCHAETSTGTLQPMNGIGELCHKHDCLLLLDTVTSICGLPVHLEAWGVDAAYAGTQKCMGCPPGVAPLSLGPRALAKQDARKSKVKNWYLDMSMIRKYLESSDGAPRVYHHTAPISMVYAMREALTLVAEEGLENCQARHRSNAEYFWSELERIGLKPYVDVSVRAPSLTTVCIPEGVDGMKVIQIMRERFQIEIGGALGSLKGKCWRIGLMGYNNRPEIVKMCISALEEAIELSKK